VPVPRIYWNEKLFFSVMEVQAPEYVSLARDLLEWQRVWQVCEAWGHGHKRGSFRPLLNHHAGGKVSGKIYTVFGGTHPELVFEMKYLRRLSPFHLSNISQVLFLRLCRLKGFTDTVIADRHYMSLSILKDPEQMDIFQDVIYFILKYTKPEVFRRLRLEVD